MVLGEGRQFTVNKILIKNVTALLKSIKMLNIFFSTKYVQLNEIRIYSIL